MKEKGVEELAFATYPPAGDKVLGDAHALLFRGGKDTASWAFETMNEIVIESTGG